MLTTLNGMFSKPKPHRIDFIKENKRKLKEISSMVNQNNSKSRFDITKSKSSQTEVSKRDSSIGLKENKNSTSSRSRLSYQGPMTVYLQEKKDKGSVINGSLSAKPKSSLKVAAQKNKSCQTINPRRCDQLYHEGVIKYPSNKVLQELAQIKKQKENRLDAHVKKEYFKRNKVKQKSPNRFVIPKIDIKKSDGGDAKHSNEEDEDKEKSIEEEEEEDDEENRTDEEEENEKAAEPAPVSEPQETPVVTNRSAKQSSQPVMRAAEIIKRTTDDFKNTPRGQNHSNHVLNSKGDAKPNKKTSKNPTKEEELLKTVLDPQCPPGHIPLPDEERKKTLHMLRVSYAELIKELNLLPVRTDTLRVRQRKIHLENQLNKIEEGIKVFSKSKVYVKIEE